jgi:hypothetical protein
MPVFNRDNSNDNSTAVYLHEFLEPAVETHRRDHADLRARLSAAEKTIKDQKDKIERLNKNLAALEARFGELLARYNEISDSWTNIAGAWTSKNHPGKQTESDNRHHDVAADYQQFRDTEVYQLVTNPEWVTRPLPAVGQAIARAELGAVLFGRQQPPAPETVRAVLEHFGIHCPATEIAEICRRAADIYYRALSLGRDQQWDFGVGDGRFDPVRQERVAGSASGEPGEVVGRIVAPGYVVGDGKVVLRQLVLTWPDPPRQAEPHPGNAQPASRSMEGLG